MSLERGFADWRRFALQSSATKKSGTVREEPAMPSRMQARCPWRRVAEDVAFAPRKHAFEVRPQSGHAATASWEAMARCSARRPASVDQRRPWSSAGSTMLANGAGRRSVALARYPRPLGGTPHDLPSTPRLREASFGISRCLSPGDGASSPGSGTHTPQPPMSSATTPAHCPLDRRGVSRIVTMSR